ncbi:MAG: hypothetical protein IT373_12790 [Polyangiaceae bacterium]|nr:hypothetical protein [Polyangiaceae bacterium]
MRRLALAACLAVSGLVGAGCGSGGGDPYAIPAADPYGSGERLTDLLGPATWIEDDNPDGAACLSLPIDREVDVPGLTISAIDSFDETGSGATGNVYVQDSRAAPVAFSGITVFEPGFSPPDLRVVAGDVVDVRGTLSEFPGPSSGPFPFCQTLPEIGGAMNLRFDGAAVPVADISVEDLTTYDKMRQWLGVLVRVKNVTIAAAPTSSSGRYSALLQVSGGATQQPSINNELFDLENDGPPLAQGTVLSSVTGVVTFFYAVHIAPRSPADIVP